MEIIKCLLHCQSVECVSNMLYWFYSTAAQSCVALVAFVAVIFTFREQKIDNRISNMIKNTIERMSVFGELRYGINRMEHAYNSPNEVLSWKNTFVLSTIIKDKAKSVSDIIKLGHFILKEFDNSLTNLIDYKSVSSDPKISNNIIVPLDYFIDFIGNLDDDIISIHDKEHALKALESTKKELEPVIAQVEEVYLLHMSSGKLRNRFAWSTVLGLITFSLSCISIVFSNNVDALWLFPIVLMLLIALIISLLFF
ncbi:MAG: hypothetical protein WCX65_19670, partial [bacterium]